MSGTSQKVMYFAFKTGPSILPSYISYLSYDGINDLLLLTLIAVLIPLLYLQILAGSLDTYYDVILNDQYLCTKFIIK